MEKGDIAILIAIASALFTAGSMIYTRRLAKNDSKRMERKPPIMEWFDTSEQFANAPEGWSPVRLEFRNVEPFNLRLINVKTKTRDGEIISIKDASDPYLKVPLTFMPDINGGEILALDQSLEPNGSARTRGNFIFRFDEHKIDVLVRHLSTVADLDLTWEWADGQK